MGWVMMSERELNRARPINPTFRGREGPVTLLWPRNAMA